MTLAFNSKQILERHRRICDGGRLTELERRDHPLKREIRDNGLETGWIRREDSFVASSGSFLALGAGHRLPSFSEESRERTALNPRRSDSKSPGRLDNDGVAKRYSPRGVSVVVRPRL